MTPLKPSEKRLLTIFGVAGFILLNLLGFSWYSKKTIALEQQGSKLEIRGRILQSLKAQAPEAEQKQLYLAKYLKAYPDETARDGYLDNFIQNEATKLGLELKKNKIEEAKLETLFHKSRYSGEVTGKWDNVLEFLRALQQPTEFRFVPGISLKSQKKEASSDEAADVVCGFSIEKWWSPDSANIPQAEAAPAVGTAATPLESEHSADSAVQIRNVTASAAPK